MLLTILGAILLASPLVLILLFKNKTLGFLLIFSSLTAFHLFISMASQAFHIFNYEVVLSVTILLALASVMFVIINKQKCSFNFKLSWLTVLAFFIIFFELFSVHYLYTGLMTTISGHKNVTNHSYPYPYFSDEWAGVAFTNYSIKTEKLPISHPLLGYNKYDFPNIFVGFFAGLAELFLILNLAPLLGYPIINILTGLLICYLVYLFLKTSGVKEFFAVFGALCLPWIVNSVNLPGVWFLLPFTGGTIFLLITLIAFNLKDKNLALGSGVISLLLYPPFIVLVAPTLLAGLLAGKKISWSQILKSLTKIAAPIFFIVILVFLLQYNNFSNLFNLFADSLIRINNEGCIPIRPIWFIIPVWLLPLAGIGIYSAFKKKLYYYLTPLLIGLIFWSVYAFTPYFLIIDYARMAVITSYLLMIAIGLGLALVFKWLIAKFKFLKNKDVMLAITIIVMLIFLFLSFFYTQREMWNKIILRYDTVLGKWDRPNDPPANAYLHADDLRLFEGLSQQIFLTIPWKGLVIGAATGNYPMESKASIVTNYQSSYEMFMLISCSNKNDTANIIKLDYLYSTPIDCPKFKYIGHSAEGLYLYKFQP